MSNASSNKDANTPDENAKPGIHAPTIARYMGAPVELTNLYSVNPLDSAVRSTTGAALHRAARHAR